MKTIPLTQGYEALVDDSDYDDVSRWKWYAVVHYRADQTVWNVYAKRSVYKGNPTIIQMHRHLLGLIDPKILCDHRDGNGLNNQRDNLRTATSTQNHGNQRKRYRASTSRFKGVNWRKDSLKWHVQIGLGSFVNEIDAAKVYNDAAIRLFGEFANIYTITHDA